MTHLTRAQQLRSRQLWAEIRRKVDDHPSIGFVGVRAMDSTLAGLKKDCVSHSDARIMALESMLSGRAIEHTAESLWLLRTDLYPIITMAAYYHAGLQPLRKLYRQEVLELRAASIGCALPA